MVAQWFRLLPRSFEVAGSNRAWSVQSLNVLPVHVVGFCFLLLAKNMLFRLIGGCIEWMLLCVL